MYRYQRNDADYRKINFVYQDIPEMSDKELLQVVISASYMKMF